MGAMVRSLMLGFASALFPQMLCYIILAVSVWLKNGSATNEIVVTGEYCILLPLEVTEYQYGQLYAVAEVSKNETGGGGGVQVVKQGEFTSKTVRPGEILNGTYTYKIYYSKSKSSWLFRKLLPDTAFILHEKCWNAYPYCKTVIANPDYMKENFHLIIESVHLPDSGETENALGLPKELLVKREEVMIDICDDSFLKQSVVQIQFKMFGFQRLVEGLCQRQYPRIFSKFNRETFCSIDKWYDMTVDDIRIFDGETTES